MKMKLNLGCGANKIPGFLGLDSSTDVGADIVFDLDSIKLGAKIPLNDNCVELVFASHLVEHLEVFFELFTELYRILTADGVVVIRGPHGASDDAWIDPTHRRPIFPQTLTYLQQPKYHSFDYGFQADFQQTECLLIVPDAATRTVADQRFDRNFCREFVTVMRVVKPKRPRDRALLSVPQGKIVTSVDNLELLRRLTTRSE